MTDTELLTPAEYARYRRCSLRTLDRERANGDGCPYVRLGSRILYRRTDIDRYIEAHVRGIAHGR
jgi:Helix-turn-helix domain